jgi:hypothetical protein
MRCCGHFRWLPQGRGGLTEQKKWGWGGRIVMQRERRGEEDQDKR